MDESTLGDPFFDYPVVGQLTAKQKSELVRALGDNETADYLLSNPSTGGTKSIFGGQSRELRPWEHISHSFGFLPASTPTDDAMPLKNAAQMQPDISLRNEPVTIRLDKISVADYPGRGVHRILFDFYARNALSGGDQEHLRYNATFRARDGQGAAAVGLPVFVDLNVGELGLAFKCNTVNVANESSQKALDMLDSDLVKAGLRLAKSAQPAIGPMSQIALGLTKAILGVDKNVRVQEFQLGLDFDDAGTGARLAQGSYFAVQVPDAAAWDWSQWVWNPSHARLTSKSGDEGLCPYNYVVFRVSLSQTG